MSNPPRLTRHHLEAILADQQRQDRAARALRASTLVGIAVLAIVVPFIVPGHI